MATEVQTGKAYIHGIRNDGSAITISGVAGFSIDTAKISHKFKMDSLEDEIGFDNALVATNAFYEQDLSFMPTGASRAAVEAGAVFILPLAQVVIANFAIEAFNGTWVYMGDMSLDLSHKQGKMSLKVRRYADEDQNTLLTTTVS